MSATKNWLYDYTTAFDEAWEALENARVKTTALNDEVYAPDGELKSRVPRADASLIANKLKELKTEIDCFVTAQELVRWAGPILPGEIRIAC